MFRSYKTREHDEHQLEILHALEVSGNAAVRARFGLSNGAIQGLRHRLIGPDYTQHECLCRKPENRDGGMPPRWWAK